MPKRPLVTHGEGAPACRVCADDVQVAHLAHRGGGEDVTGGRGDDDGGDHGDGGEEASCGSWQRTSSRAFLRRRVSAASVIGIRGSAGDKAHAGGDEQHAQPAQRRDMLVRATSGPAPS